MRNKILEGMAWLEAHKNLDVNREEGQGVVEYALVVGGVSIVIIAVLATAAEGWIESVSGAVSSAIGDFGS